MTKGIHWFINKNIINFQFYEKGRGYNGDNNCNLANELNKIVNNWNSVIDDQLILLVFTVLLLGAVHQSEHRNSTRAEMDTAIKTVLKNAGDWDGHRGLRKINNAQPQLCSAEAVPVSTPPYIIEINKMDNIPEISFESKFL